ncbi:MAG: hypothetical protein U0802_06570 [Candidatus Binatia bacterium]
MRRYFGADLGWLAVGAFAMLFITLPSRSPPTAISVPLRWWR